MHVTMILMAVAHYFGRTVNGRQYYIVILLQIYGEYIATPGIIALLVGSETITR